MNGGPRESRVGRPDDRCAAGGTTILRCRQFPPLLEVAEQELHLVTTIFSNLFGSE